MKKSAALLSVLLAGTMLFASCGNNDSDESVSSNEEESVTMSYPVLDSSNVKLLGRTYLADDTLYLVFPVRGLSLHTPEPSLRFSLLATPAQEQETTKREWRYM